PWPTWYVPEAVNVPSPLFSSTLTNSVPGYWLYVRARSGRPSPFQSPTPSRSAVVLKPRSKIQGSLKVPSPLPRYTSTAPLTPEPAAVEPATAMSCLSPTTTEVEEKEPDRAGPLRNVPLSLFKSRVTWSMAPTVTMSCLPRPVKSPTATALGPKP